VVDVGDRVKLEILDFNLVVKSFSWHDGEVW
jgi:hypothetical protein